jgi:hypothetical protein
MNNEIIKPWTWSRGKGMRGDVLVDLRNVYQAGEAVAAGLRYQGIGRSARQS